MEESENMQQYEQTNGQWNQSYGQPNDSNGQWNQPYGQSNDSNGQWNQPYGQPVHGEVRDMFCIALLIVLPVRMFLSMILNVMTLLSMSGISYSDMAAGSYMNQIAVIAANPVYTVLSTLNNVLLLAYVIFVIMDIRTVRAANYKTTGLILFAIFLNYGYYIWRAYVLGRKKTVPIVYTVCYALLGLVNVIVTIICTVSISFGMVGVMF